MAEQFKDVPVASLLRRFEESKKYRQKYETDWDSIRSQYLGDQWQGVEKIAWFQSEPVYNKIYEFIEIHRGYLSDSQWGVDVVPSRLPKRLAEDAQSAQDDPDFRLAPTQDAVGVDPVAVILDMVDKIDKLLDFLWRENRMKAKLSEVILYMFLYGTGFMKSVFDPDNVGDSGIGQIETKVLSPWYIFPDPDATSVHDASFIIEHHPVTFRWILERYPDRAAEVKEAGLGSETQYNERQGSTPRGAASTDEAQRVDIYECWYLDSTITEDEDGDVKPTMKYPNGRMTLMTSTGVVLEDKPSQYGQFPYVRFVEVPRPGEFFGDCTASRCVPIQELINQVLRTIIDNGLWLVHGIWVADTTSGITPESLVGYGPRDVIVKNPGTEVRRDEGQQLPPHLFEMLNSLERAFDRVAGTPDVLRGIVPSRQPVQTTQMQQEAGEVRTRERQRRVEESLEDLAKLWLDIASEHWSDKRVIRNRRMLGGFDMFEMSKKELQEWKFDVHVVPGSTSPTSQERDLEKAFQLIERGGVQVPPMYLVELSRLAGLYSAMAEDMAMPEEEVPIDGTEPIENPEMPLVPEPEMGAPEIGMEQPLPDEMAVPSPEELAQLGLV